MMIVQQIIRIAKSFDGIKEVGNNEGWEDRFYKEFNRSFLELMKTVGWKETHAWCAYFAELVWKLGYAQLDSRMVLKLDKLFSASAVMTWNNFKKSDFECSHIPKPGAIVIWQSYKAGKQTSSGHAGVVIEVDGNAFISMEGNTNAAGSREGNQVAEKGHLLTVSKKENGLNLLGFIYPKEV